MGGMRIQQPGASSGDRQTLQFILPVLWVGERVKLGKFLCKWNTFFKINCKMSWI